MNKEKISLKESEKGSAKANSPEHILQLPKYAPKETPNALSLDELVSLLTKSQREKLISGYDIKIIAPVFEDVDLMHTVNAFLNNGMNVSKTARALYMHRNTLNYRLKALYKKTGIDVRSFEMAVTFKILHILYLMK